MSMQLMSAEESFRILRAFRMSDHRGIISIDFGTSRTKMAYFDSSTNRPELFRIGEDEKPYIPSFFYLSENGSIHCGDEALSLGKDDPAGLLDQPLKRSLRENIIIAGNCQKSTPKILLQRLLSELHSRLLLHHEFSRIGPKKVVFTIPSQYGRTDEQLIREAAINAGFKEDSIMFVNEPVAAALAWFAETNLNTEYIVVLDCGGGTLDWTCLKQEKPGFFQLIPELPPDGDIRIGGYDIDEEIFKHIISFLDAEDVGYCRLNKNMVIRQIQNLKEKFSKTNANCVLQLENKKFNLSAKDLEVIVKQRYVNQVLCSISTFIDKVKTKLHIEIPDVLLVGGSSKFTLLRHDLEASGLCKPIVWERSEYATVLGGTNYVHTLIDSNNDAGMINKIAESREGLPAVNLPMVSHNKEYYHKRAVDCYKIISAYYEDDAYIEAVSNVLYFPSITSQNLKNYVEVIKPLWSDIANIFGFDLTATRSVNRTVESMLPELVSDLTRDYMKITEYSVYYKAIAAKTVTLRLGIELSMLTARSKEIQGINMRALSTLIRKLCDQPNSLQPAQPDKGTILKLVESVGGYSIERFNETVDKALSNF